MTESQTHPKRRPIPARALTPRERSWIQEIVETNKLWADFDLGATKVVAECDCGECRTAYLESPQNLSLNGTRGYIGRIEIRTRNEFGITVTLDELDGRLSELHVNAVDLTEEGTRPFAEEWEETAHIVEPM
jgi:hypothetical protein